MVIYYESYKIFLNSYFYIYIMILIKRLDTIMLLRTVDIDPLYDNFLYTSFAKKKKKKKKRSYCAYFLIVDDAPHLLAQVCRVCGLLGYYNHKLKAGICSSCKNGDNISTMKLPYACKLLIQVGRVFFFLIFLLYSIVCIAKSYFLSNLDTDMR